MNCNTCRYELSQCLDGRLPSGRRALVMQHAESCAACGQFWTELQAAQQLTLRLRSTPVGTSFREGLWERIHAGEGTPEAVFHEPVPLWTKVRYTLTGAAAAAAVLLASTWLRSNPFAPTGRASDDGAPIAVHAPPPGATPGGGGAAEGPGLRERRRDRDAVVLADNPLISATRPLTFNLVAAETAKQLEQRHAAVSNALRLIDDPGSNRDAAVAQAIDNADEFRAFGELLLDLRDRQRLFFTDTQVSEDLRVAVSMLGQDLLRGRSGARDLRTVRGVVAPALSSKRLGEISRTITVVPETDPQDDLETLVRLNRTRPEVFSKLFFVLGHVDELAEDVRALPPGTMFLMEDVCGPSWVAPRSEVEARDHLLRMLRRQFGDSGDVQIQIEVRSKRD